jgi:hypothetical protein
MRYPTAGTDHDDSRRPDDLHPRRDDAPGHPSSVRRDALTVECGERTEKLHHRAILKNYLRHLLLERSAKLIGERIYVDSASYTYDKLSERDVVTPEQATRELAPLLARADLG